jgi:spore maturation protein CgeB
LYRTSMGFRKDAPRVVGAQSLNPRAYELAATGCFTISDYRDEVVEIFGDSVPTFSTAEELQSQVRRWLADDSGREALAARLPALVAGQTWAARAAQMEADLRSACTVAGSDDSRRVVA